MGLDFIVQRRRRGPAYEACSWDDVYCGRNCWMARDIVLDSISTYDKEICEAKLTIGAIQKILKNLIKETEDYDFNDPSTKLNDGLSKTFDMIAGLAKILTEDCLDYEFDGIEYEYKLIDSY